MILQEVFEQFAQHSPATVMFRAVAEYAFSHDQIDELFRTHAQQQWENELLFSTAVELLGLAVTGKAPSLHAAYRARQEQIPVSVKSVYNKLNATEPLIARALVREPARRLTEVLRRMNPARPGPNPPLLPGYRVKILDGKHLDGTQHRLQETRTTHAAPLPGLLLAVLDPQLSLVLDVFPEEDAYSQERSLLPGLYETIQANDLWIADRNFCTTGALFTIAGKQAFFLIRQHGSTLHGKTLQGRRRLVGRCETGTVYEQTMEILNPEPQEDQAKRMLVRRLTLELDQPTRDGETEIHLLTNLPARVDAIRLAKLYRERWQIEQLLGEISQCFEGEIDTLCHPPAALLAFCLALMTYNIQSVLKGAIQQAHGEQVKVPGLSTYYLADEISGVYGGMMISLPAEYWTGEFSEQSSQEMAEFLLETASRVPVARFRKTTRGERKEPPQRTGGNRDRHVSTARLLAARKKTKTTDN
jgi:hypothetical protein